MCLLGGRFNRCFKCGTPAPNGAGGRGGYGGGVGGAGGGGGGFSGGGGGVAPPAPWVPPNMNSMAQFAGLNPEDLKLLQYVVCVCVYQWLCVGIYVCGVRLRVRECVCVCVLQFAGVNEGRRFFWGFCF